MQKEFIATKNIYRYNKPELAKQIINGQGYGFSRQKYHYIKKENKLIPQYLIQYIRNRLWNLNQNFTCIIQGPPGTGKSWSSLSIALSVDPYFPIQRCIFSSDEFVDIVRSEPPKGSAIVFEEAGVGLNNLNFWSANNQSANKILQTYRRQNLCLILNSPVGAFIDAKTLRLIDCEMTTSGINRKERYCRLNFNFLFPNYYKKKEVYRNPLKVYNTKTMSWDYCNELNVFSPPKSLLNAYEEKKISFTRSLNKKISDELSQKQVFIK